MKNTEHFDKNLSYWQKFVLPNIRNPQLKDPYLYIKDEKNRDLVYEKNFDVSKYSIQKKEQKVHTQKL